ncbi:hypothetical protein [Paenibacillus sp. P46E]|uniref:hypothetical protein n=1 Tax=Paenibacillus sp. P46E TaxID=1349436 RepID=UPI000938B976|nr:hypothetical protein [Paenibacillus sp. P46E]OKP99095.1 hypothetical protein A3849_06555 [Paenibacillus sp. P46E]
MNKKQRTIIATLRNYPSFPIDQILLEETIKGATGELSQAQAKRKTSIGEFYKVQLRFMRWKVWVVQLLIVLGMALLLYNSVQERNGNIQLIMLTSIAAPLLVIAGIQTMTQSISFNMQEIELSTYHRLEKLTLVRMSLLGMADLIGLTLLGGLLSAWTETGILDLVLYLLVPFNLTCFGCLWLLNRVRTRNCGYYCLLYCGLVVTGQMFLTCNPSLGLFESSAKVKWLVLLLLTTLGVVRQVNGLRKTCCSHETASSIQM